MDRKLPRIHERLPVRNAQVEVVDEGHDRDAGFQLREEDCQLRLQDRRPNLTHVGRPVVDFGDELARLDVDHGEVVRIAYEDELEAVHCGTKLFTRARQYASSLQRRGTHSLLRDDDLRLKLPD